MKTAKNAKAWNEKWQPRWIERWVEEGLVTEGAAREAAAAVKRALLGLTPEEVFDVWMETFGASPLKELVAAVDAELEEEVACLTTTS